MDTKSLYRLEIAPLVIIPLTRSPLFSYASDTAVPRGSLVSVSFGTQTVEGIVYGCDPLPGRKPTWMKDCSRVVAEHFLTTTQCDLALQVSEEYFTPLGKTLKHFLPKHVEERKSSETAMFKKKTALRATKKEQTLLAKLSPAALPFFFDTTQDIDSERLFLLLAKQVLAHHTQGLFLVPEITLIFPLAARLRTYYGNQVVILHSKLSAGALSTVWERIRSGEALIVVATRQGLFAPFQTLATVIVTEEQDESYKQWDMSPRYQGKQVAMMLANLHRATLILSSGTPSTETLFLLEEKHILPLVPMLPHSPLGSALVIVNLKLERYRKNFSPLSEALAQALRTTYDRGEQALLYINRQGQNAFSVCDQCKNTFRCKVCDHPLSSTKDGRFRCVACGYSTPLFPSCPSCGHLSFRHVGFGTEKVEREVGKLLPHATIARLDSTTLRGTKAAETLYEQGQRGDIDILVGTQMALKDPPLPKLALIAMIDADSLLLFPHFRADERLFQDLSRAVRQVAKRGEGGPGVFVQTFHPESAFLQKITTLGSKEVLAAILTDRRELSYPPFFRFVTLTCQGKSEKEAKKKALAVRTRLEDTLPKTCRLRQSSTVRFLKKQACFESDILLRFPATDRFLPQTIVVPLQHESGHCLIDVDPLTAK